MSIFLNNNFGLKNNIENKPTEGKQIVSGKLSNLPEYISALKEGSVFKGEILDVRNTAIKILLGSNDVLNARTDGSVQLNIGDILNFRVEENTGLSMLVKAVSTGTANGNTMLLNALQSAEVPVNERNLGLVQELVDNGQPIDKNTIKTLVSNLNSVSELDTKTAVTMFKHDIPITKENVVQFNNYMQQNNKLMDSYNGMANDIINTLNEFTSKNPEGDVIEFTNTILQTITGDDGFDIINVMKGLNQESAVVAGEENVINGENIVADNAEGNVIIKNNMEVENNASNQLTENMDDNAHISAKREDLPLDNKFELQYNTENFKEELKEIVKKNLFIDKEIFNKLENEIKEELEKYYKNIEHKTDKLMSILENAGMEKSVLHNTANNVKANLNFMNDLNNMALYMQLPVKFQENEAHGELYVLNRNRNKNKESDVLTAFIHLDMENLGATDVSIKLENDKLTTKFMIEDVVSQDIVEEHLHELKKRLDEKGYQTTLLIEELKNDEEEKKTPFEQVLLLEEPKNFIKRYTFDVRA